MGGAKLHDTLRRLVESAPERALCDPQWVASGLRELHVDDSRVWVLAVAAEEDVARLILNGLDWDAAARRLADRRRLNPDAATWAASVWAYAVGRGCLISPLSPALRSTTKQKLDRAERTHVARKRTHRRAWTRNWIRRLVAAASLDPT